MQIGEVAQRVGLSLRTIRYYEEMGLVVPSARSAGGFRLYTETDVARLALIKRMKPLDFSLDESRDLLSVLDALDASSESEKEVLVERLELFLDAARARVVAVQEKLAVAEEFADELSRELQRQKNGSHAGD
jgi:MerR family copper efflux transcriptional regulator